MAERVLWSDKSGKVVAFVKLDDVSIAIMERSARGVWSRGTQEHIGGFSSKMPRITRSTLLQDAWEAALSLPC